MSRLVRFEIRDGVAIVTIDNPPVNALSQNVRQHLFEAFERVAEDPEIDAVLLCADGETFPAGADTREFGQRQEFPSLAELCERVETCPKPVVAAVPGRALGSGFELALACHYRFAKPEAIFGLPEVNLGVPPAGGSTQRLPRILGAHAALELMISGQPIAAKRAEELSLVDRVFHNKLEILAGNTARGIVRKGLGPRPTCDRTEGLSDAAGYMKVITAWRSQTEGSSLQAVKGIVDCVEAALLLPFENGVVLENMCFEECEGGAEAQALRHVFLAERRAAKQIGSADANPREIKSVGIVGDGAPASSLARILLDFDIAVTLHDSTESNYIRLHEKIIAGYSADVDKGLLVSEARDQKLPLLEMSGDVESLREADLVILTDDEEDASDLYELSLVLGETAIVATTSPTRVLDDLAQALARPGEVVGLHFQNWFAGGRLLEIAAPENVSQDVIATCLKLARKLRFAPVQSNVAVGSITSRILLVMHETADRMLQEGAIPSQIDDAMRAYGFSAGPYQFFDIIGLDVLRRLRAWQDTGNGKSTNAISLVDKIYQMGWLGADAGQGYYIHGDYGDPVDNPNVLELLEEERKGHARPLKLFTQSDIQRQILTTLANEGACLVEAGIAQRPSDIDIVLTSGFGFPRYRGGPMMAADQEGLLNIEKSLKSRAVEWTEYGAPAALFATLIKNGQHFSDLNTADAGSSTLSDGDEETCRTLA